MNNPTSTTEHINYQIESPSLVRSGNMLINPAQVAWANIDANVGTDEAPEPGVVVQFINSSTPVSFSGYQALDIAMAITDGALEIDDPDDPDDDYEDSEADDEPEYFGESVDLEEFLSRIPAMTTSAFQLTAEQLFAANAFFQIPQGQGRTTLLALLAGRTDL